MMKQDLLSLFEQLTSTSPRILLESAEPRDKVGEHSYIFWEPRAQFWAHGDDCRMEIEGEFTRRRVNPFDLLQNFFETLRQKKSSSFGLVGFIGYEAGRFLERLPNGRHDPDLAEVPDMYFMAPGKVVVVKHKEMRSAECGVRNAECGMGIRIPHSEFRSTMSRAQFEAMVRRAKEYITAGDIYQANLSQRFSFEYEGEPLELYRRLRSINPSPFSAFIDLGDLQIVSSSPERLIRLRRGICETRPIAGTRPRGKTSLADRRLSKELILNQKERAEHLMLVDLERNDLGRVSDYRTVRVDEWMTLEKYSHVIHIVSNVKGRLARGRSAFDVIRAMFPGGTITGCPKIRSMEIIHELEPVRRSVYTGSIGYIGFDGSMDFNIVIRSILCHKGKGFIQVGAGIVHDSIPRREYEETMHKAKAMLMAVQGRKR